MLLRCLSCRLLERAALISVRGVGLREPAGKAIPRGIESPMARAEGVRMGKGKGYNHVCTAMPSQRLACVESR